MSLINAISTVNWIFGNFVVKNSFLFFTDFILLMFFNNIVKNLEILIKWNLLKTCIQTTVQLKWFFKIPTPPPPLRTGGVDFLAHRRSS